MRHKTVQAIQDFYEPSRAQAHLTFSPSFLEIDHLVGAEIALSASSEEAETFADTALRQCITTLTKV